MSKKYCYNTYKEAMEAVRKFGFYLKDVRPDLQTPELAEIAVKDWGGNLEYVRPDLFTQELALRMVKRNWYNLKHTPAHLQTQEVIEAALKQNPDAKYFIKIKVLIMEALGEALGE